MDLDMGLIACRIRLFALPCCVVESGAKGVEQLMSWLCHGPAAVQLTAMMSMCERDTEVITVK